MSILDKKLWMFVPVIFVVTMGCSDNPSKNSFSIVDQNNSNKTLSAECSETLVEGVLVPACLQEQEQNTEENLNAEQKNEEDSRKIYSHSQQLGVCAVRLLDAEGENKTEPLYLELKSGRAHALGEAAATLNFPELENYKSRFQILKNSQTQNKESQVQLTAGQGVSVMVRSRVGSVLALQLESQLRDKNGFQAECHSSNLKSELASVEEMRCGLWIQRKNQSAVTKVSTLKFAGESVQNTLEDSQDYGKYIVRLREARGDSPQMIELLMTGLAHEQTLKVVSAAEKGLEVRYQDTANEAHHVVICTPASK